MLDSSVIALERESVCVCVGVCVCVCVCARARARSHHARMYVRTCERPYMRAHASMFYNYVLLQASLCPVVVSSEDFSSCL